MGLIKSGLTNAIKYEGLINDAGVFCAVASQNFKE